VLMEMNLRAWWKHVVRSVDTCNGEIGVYVKEDEMGRSCSMHFT
jgi:hypothetical protein